MKCSNLRKILVSLPVGVLTPTSLRESDPGVAAGALIDRSCAALSVRKVFHSP